MMDIYDLIGEIFYKILVIRFAYTAPKRLYQFYLFLIIEFPVLPDHFYFLLKLKRYEMGYYTASPILLDPDDWR